MPVLVQEWNLNPEQTGLILSMGYLGQLLGAWTSSRVSRGRRGIR